MEWGLPDKAIAGVQGVTDLALPVVVMGDEAGATRSLVRNAASLLARPVDLWLPSTVYRETNNQEQDCEVLNNKEPT
jgi:hypothetical protein